MNLFNALLRTSSMTMISRVLGLVREIMNAHQFAAGPAMDAFNIAFRLPNMFRRLFAEGAFSQAFVPILAEYKTQKGDDAAREFLADVTGLLTLILVTLTALFVIGAPIVVILIASGFRTDPAKFGLATNLTRILFPYIMLISLSSLASGVLNTWNRYSVSAFTPALLNISMIGCGWFLSPFFDQPIYALAIGVVIGGIAQVSFQLPYLARIKMLPMPRLAFGDHGVHRVLKQMVPALLGVSAAQISQVINSQIASYLPGGSISWMNYADRLMELPTGVLGVALGTILLPSLSKLNAKGDSRDYSRMLDWGLRLCFLLALPATVALGVISLPLVSTLFQTGKFGIFDVLMTQRSLIAYAVGLLGLIVPKILIPAFYARQDIRTPVRIAISTLIVTQILNQIFLHFTHLAHAGLALSISLGACLNATLLFITLRRRGIYQPEPQWAIFSGKLIIAVLCMATVLTLGNHALGEWTTMTHIHRIVGLALLVGGGAVSYFGALGLMGFRPRDFARRAA